MAFLHDSTYYAAIGLANRDTPSVFATLKKASGEGPWDRHRTDLFGYDGPELLCFAVEVAVDVHAGLLDHLESETRRWSDEHNDRVRVGDVRQVLLGKNVIGTTADDSPRRLIKLAIDTAPPAGADRKRLRLVAALYAVLAPVAAEAARARN